MRKWNDLRLILLSRAGALCINPCGYIRLQFHNIHKNFQVDFC